MWLCAGMAPLLVAPLCVYLIEVRRRRGKGKVCGRRGGGWKEGPRGGEGGDELGGGLEGGWPAKESELRASAKFRRPRAGTATPCTLTLHTHSITHSITHTLRQDDADPACFKVEIQKIMDCMAQPFVYRPIIAMAAIKFLIFDNSASGKCVCVFVRSTRS